MTKGVTDRFAIDDFGAFYERTYPVAVRTAMGICRDAALADEVTQDAYLSAWRTRDRYRGDGHPDAWLMRIVVNSALSGLRRRRVRRAESLDETAHVRPGPHGTDAADSMAMRHALDALDGRHRAVVVLRYYHDLEYAAIASILGTSTGNVGSMLSRALARLRVDLSHDEPPRRGRLEASHHGRRSD